MHTSLAFPGRRSSGSQSSLILAEIPTAVSDHHLTSRPAFTETMPMFDYYFRNPFGTQRWHTDMAYEHQPPGYT